MNLHHFSLPLLTKELAEQSARRRTFVVRTAYAALLYGLTLSLYGWGSGPNDALGTGGRLFSGVLAFQFLAIYALLPMLTAGVLTSEKERDTLGLLLITRLGPWTIILEKYFSRVIPMLLYLLMSVPLLAVAYSLGGVDSGAVLRAGIALTLCLLQVGAFGVFFSAWCRTTAQALVCTYLGLILFPPGWIMLAGMMPKDPQAYFMDMHAPSAEHLVGAAWVSTVGIFVMLLLARAVLWQRAFLHPKEYLLKLLRSIDTFMNEINQNSLTHGIVLISDDQTLPLDQPIAWRETSRRAFGTTRYLVRLLIVIETPLLVWLIGPMTDPNAWSQGMPPGFIELWLLWWLGALMIIAKSTALVAGERTRQTLDVLLSTPLSAQQIVRQKFAGLWRLMLVLAIPFATAAGMRLWSAWHHPHPNVVELRLEATVQACAAVLVYWPLVALVGFIMGVRCRSQLQAMTATLAVVLVTAAMMFAVQWSVTGDSRLMLEPFFPIIVHPLPQARMGLEPPFLPVERALAILAHLALYVGAYFLLWRLAPALFSHSVQRCECRTNPGTARNRNQALDQRLAV